VLAIQLGFSEQWVRQTMWKGSKAIEIGTGRAMPVRWLTSLDDPVQVLQLTGAVLTSSSKVLRVGVEGLLARRTGMTASVLGAQEVLTEEELAALGGRPASGGDPVWRSALRDLVRGLLATGCAIERLGGAQRPPARCAGPWARVPGTGAEAQASGGRPTPCRSPTGESSVTELP